MVIPHATHLGERRAGVERGGHVWHHAHSTAAAIRFISAIESSTHTMGGTKSDGNGHRQHQQEVLRAVALDVGGGCSCIVGDMTARLPAWAA